jgi:hypothetical protein
MDFYRRDRKLWSNAWIVAKTAAAELQIPVPEVEIMTAVQNETDLWSYSPALGFADAEKIYILDGINNDQLMLVVPHEVRHYWQFQKCRRPNEDDAVEYAAEFFKRESAALLGLYP